jgi:hypothetical protein
MYYDPLFKKEIVEKELSKLQKLNYNKFRWWRMYTDGHTPLPNKSLFIDKILNGDFNPSLYMWQVWLVEHDLNEIWSTSKNDMSMFLENTSVQRARRKRLTEDFEKEEFERMYSLYEHFFKYFDIDRDQLEEEMLECSGELKDLYYIIKNKYTHQIRKSKRGRPKKYED